MTLHATDARVMCQVRFDAAQFDNPRKSGPEALQRLRTPPIGKPDSLKYEGFRHDGLCGRAFSRALFSQRAGPLPARIYSPGKSQEPLSFSRSDDLHCSTAKQRRDKDIDSLKEQADAHQLSIDRRAKLDEIDNSIGRISDSPRPGQRESVSTAIDPHTQKLAHEYPWLSGRIAGHDGAALAERASALRQFMLGGMNSLSPQQALALQVDTHSAGGTLVLPEEFVARLIKGVDDRVFIRMLATILPLTDAESVGIPSLDADPDDADWTSEIATGAEDNAMATGKRKLTPHPLAKRIKISRTLLRKSVIPAEGLVTDRLSYKFAVTEEKAFLLGSGANQPLGIFVPSTEGISTARDISSGNTATNIGADGLINAKFGLKSQYMASPNLRWLLHRDGVREVRKLKDLNNQYLWTAGLAGEPDTILEVPYIMSEFVPNTFTTGQYVGAIADFTWYWIAESLRFELQRVDELYAETNQVGFIGRQEIDAQPVLEEAFVRVKLA